MSVPLWCLLGFASWTVLLLLTTVGVYRWSRILTGRAPIAEFRADRVVGEDWYCRAMRAHANCVENLPVFGALVFVLHAAGIASATADSLCVVIVLARIVQSLVHVSVVQSNAVVSVRFAFFLVQIVGFLWLAVIAAGRALG
jgi:uncharacterized MAPEG superfamily protein